MQRVIKQFHGYKQALILSRLWVYPIRISTVNAIDIVSSLVVGVCIL